MKCVTQLIIINKIIERLVCWFSADMYVTSEQTLERSWHELKYRWIQTTNRGTV